MVKFNEEKFLEIRLRAKDPERIDMLCHYCDEITKVVKPEALTNARWICTSCWVEHKGDYFEE